MAQFYPGTLAQYPDGINSLTRFPGLPALLANPEPQVKRNRDRLAYEYFLNGLYVALSRARGRLLIVDTGDAIEKFWRFARGQGYEDLIGQYKSSGGFWRLANLGLAIKGESGAWQEDARDENADIGRQLFDNGYENRDPYLLERAASRFDRVLDESNALNARAWACHYREDYAQAGRMFARIPDVPHALDNLWLAGEYADFVNLARNKAAAGDPRFHAARYMGSHHREEDARTLFAAVYSAITESGRMVSAADMRMRGVLDAAFETLLARLDAAPDDERAQGAARGDNAHVALVSASLDWSPHPSVGYAALMALGGQDEGAAQSWKATRRPDAEAPEVLVQALANATPFPENLSYLRRLLDFDRIVAETRAADGAKVPVKVAAAIAADLRRFGDTERFEGFALALPGTKAFAVFEGIPVDSLNADAHAKALVAKLITRLAETGELKAFLGCVVAHSLPELSKDKQAWLGTVVSNSPGLHRSAIRALAAVGIDRELLDIPLKDRIDQYFDGLIKARNAELSGISPFEVGAVLEHSGKYRLMQQYYEMVLKARGRQTDRAITDFARERLVFAQFRLAEVAIDPRVRRRIEEQYKRSAREWSVDLSQLPLTISLHGYREAIERFYDAREIRTAAPTEKSAPGVAGLPFAVVAAIAPDAPEAPVIPMNTLAEASASSGSTPVPADVKAPLARGGQADGAVERTGSAKDSYAPVNDGRKETDTVTVRTNGIELDMNCDYDVRRIDIRNIATRDAVVVKIRNGILSVGSADFVVTRNHEGAYLLGDWPVVCTASADQDGRILVDVQVLDDGPVVRLRI